MLIEETNDFNIYDAIVYEENLSRLLKLIINSNKFNYQNQTINFYFVFDDNKVVLQYEQDIKLGQGILIAGISSTVIKDVNSLRDNILRSFENRNNVITRVLIHNDSFNIKYLFKTLVIGPNDLSLIMLKDIIMFNVYNYDSIYFCKNLVERINKSTDDDVKEYFLYILKNKMKEV